MTPLTLYVSKTVYFSLLEVLKTAPSAHAGATARTSAVQEPLSLAGLSQSFLFHSIPVLVLSHCIKEEIKDSDASPLLKLHVVHCHWDQK